MKTNKIKQFAYEHKREIIGAAVLTALTILLCVPFTLKYAVKVFGWTAYFYLALGWAEEIKVCLNKKTGLMPKSVIMLAVTLIFVLATLHIAFGPKGSTRFVEYVVYAYENGTVGGVVFSVLTGIFVAYCTYPWALVIFLLGTITTSFFFMRPFIFAGTRSPVGERKKKVVSAPRCREIIMDESPFLHKRATSPKPVPIMTDAKPERSAFDKLFGEDEEEDDSAPGDFSVSFSGNSYNVKKVGLREPEKDLFTEDKPPVKEEEVEPEEEEIFGRETDDNVVDILAPVDSEFLRGLRQRGFDAPRPTIRNLPEETLYDNDEREEETSGAAYEEPVPVAATEERVEEEVPYEPEETPVEEPPRPVTKPSRVVPSPTPPLRPRTEPVRTEPQREVKPEPVPAYLQPKKPTLPYNKPPLSLLQSHISPNFNPQVDNWDELKEVFEVKLKNFGVSATLVDAIKGPTVTLCVLDLSEDCPIKKLTSVSDDLQRLLKSTKPVNIIKQIPNTSYCGVQIPNEVKGIVGFKEIITSREYREAKGDLLVAFGKTAEGKILIEDIASMPHALVAGSTGSGKSVCLNVMLASLLFRYTPDEVKFLLIDLKEVEMALYSGLPHMLLKEPLSKIPEITNALNWAREEVVNRFSLFKSLHVKNLNEYNALEGVKKLPRILIVIDEASELMTDPVGRKTLEQTLSSLARIARAAGAHLIFATQNPVKEVITNEIQNNLNTKIAFAVGDYNHSMVIFKAKGAETLLGKGDMYIKRGSDMVRAQCAFIDTDELEAACDYIRENNEIEFDEEEIEKILNGNANNKQDSSVTASSGGQTQNKPSQAESEDDEDGLNGPDLNWQALKIIVENNYVSCSFLQRKLKKGYNTIATVLEELAAEGYISSVPQGSKEKRNILISKEDFYREWEERYGKGDEDYDMEHFDDDDEV